MLRLSRSTNGVRARRWLVWQEETIQELRETVEILEMKMAKLEQLVRLKDAKIQRMSEEINRLTAGRGSNH